MSIDRNTVQQLCEEEEKGAKGGVQELSLHNIQYIKYSLKVTNHCEQSKTC